jgi:hypothetical protein
MREPKKFSARAGGRVLTVYRHEQVEVKLTWLTSLLTRRKDKKGRPIPRRVEFPVTDVQGMRWRNAGILWPGCLTIQAPPGSGDPWRRSGREKPHKFRFSRNSAAEARLLRIAWVIQLSYCQQHNGALLARKLPPQKPVPPTLVERLLTELGLRPAY